MTKIRAFSLAEAMITLLIVCLITIASIPVITKKRRNLESQKGHGVWVCYRDANDTLKSYAIIDGAEVPGGEIKDKSIDTIISKGDAIFPADKPLDFGCKFVPPPNTRDFIVTYIGAGGGGGRGRTVEYNQDISNGTILTIPNDGKYNVLLVGAGGGGGGNHESGSSSCDESSLPVSSAPKNPCGGLGGSAGYIFKKGIELKKDDKLSATVASGGGCSNGYDWSERAGTSNLKYNNSEVWKIFGGWRGGSIDYDKHNTWRGPCRNRDLESCPNDSEYKEHIDCGGNTCGLYNLNNQVTQGGYPFITAASGSPFLNNVTKVGYKGKNTSDRAGGHAAYVRKSYSKDAKTGANVDNGKFPLSNIFTSAGAYDNFDPSLFGLGMDELTFRYSYGWGGMGEWGDNNSCVNGGGGVAKVYSKIAISGKGGSAGTMMPPQSISTISSGIWAFPGVGGGGQFATLIPAKSGTPTKVDRFPVAQGGAAAILLDSYNEVVGGLAVGAEGGATATYHTSYNKKNYGGLALNNNVRNGATPTTPNLFTNSIRFPHAAGVGGAGGGADVTDWSNGSTITGDGGKGASGAVIIEW